jgi:TolB-like protein/Flp pilus assembly protein TadD
METKTVPSIELQKEPPSLEESARHQLTSILESKSFRQVDRLQRFLRFIVEETLAGRGSMLKEYPIGIEVFGKESSFDPRMDPIVRVQARRLRIRLTNYYRDEGQGDEIIIELPKGGYTPNLRRSENIVSKRPAGALLVSRNIVAVLPFTDDTASADHSYFCSGLTQEIVDCLSKEDRIILVSRNRTEDLSRSDNTAPVAALVIDGSVRKSRDMLRITIHLSDAVRGYLIWSHSIDRSPEDIFAIQEEVAQLALGRIREELVSSTNKKSSRHQTQNLAAHGMYTQGRYHLSQRTDQGLRRAVDFFSKAIAEDPQFAEAYAGLADAENLLAHYGVLAPADVWTKAASNAAQAVMLDAESSVAYASFAHVKSTQEWDWEGAEREYLRAIQLDPTNPTAHHWYAVTCLTPLGRLEQALEELRMAQTLDPVSSIISRDIALNHYYRRDFDSALDTCDRTIEQNPHFSAAYWTLGLVQEERGDFDEALAAFKRAIDLSPPSLRILGALGRTLARAGRNDEAVRVLGELEDMGNERYISPFDLALLYFAFEQLDEGFKYLLQAYQDRCYDLVIAKVDPRLDSVANDPRLAALIRQMGLP